MYGTKEREDKAKFHRILQLTAASWVKDITSTTNSTHKDDHTPFGFAITTATKSFAVFAGTTLLFVGVPLTIFSVLDSAESKRQWIDHLNNVIAALKEGSGTVASLSSFFDLFFQRQ
jgi:hypothetical protein